MDTVYRRDQGDHGTMSNKAQITQRAARDNVPAATVERDYVLTHVIAGLASIPQQHGLVFKGGTALRLCFFEEYRYSADLDFSVVTGTIEDAYEVIQAALAATGGAIDTLYLTDDDPIKIAYQGPLGRERKLKLDIADDEIVLNTETIGLIPRWDDMPDQHGLTVYSLSEITGEKLRCVMQRLQCRERWAKELNIHVAGDIPHFDQVERSVARHLRKAGLL